MRPEYRGNMICTFWVQDRVSTYPSVRTVDFCWPQPVRDRPACRLESAPATSKRSPSGAVRQADNHPREYTTCFWRLSCRRPTSRLGPARVPARIRHAGHLMLTPSSSRFLGRRRKAPEHREGSRYLISAPAYILAAWTSHGGTVPPCAGQAAKLYAGALPWLIFQSRTADPKPTVTSNALLYYILLVTTTAKLHLEIFAKAAGFFILGNEP